MNNAKQIAMHIRANDIVEVTAGEDRGVRGKVLKVLPEKR